ncbi:hypothetical protein ACP93_02655 [Xanthomonas sp. NCPPB 1128]|nr:hypothetical protein ACP93_02390 [Xanthomonas sp. NCPPB 1128]KMM77123.1 hypothetical protein ACP93_02655 [Xanthomonas sp. NCPPB 1128]
MANGLTDFMGGYQAGNAIVDQQRQQLNQNKLTNLAPRVVAGDPAAFAQAAAVDPQAAQAYAGAGDNLALKARGAAKYLQAALQSGNQQQIMAARQTIKPFMDTLKPGTAYPLDMDPAQEAQGIGAFLAQTAYLDPDLKGGTPTGFREFQMKAAAAGLQPGTPEYQNAAKIALGQEGRASSSGFTQVKFTGPDGRERIGVLNGRTGRIDLPDGTSFDPQTGGVVGAMSAPSAPVLPQGGGQQVIEQDAQLANQMIAAGIPADQVDRFLRGRASQFSGGSRPAMPATNAGTFVGRAPEEQAAATEAAKQAAQLQYLPQELGMRTNAALSTAAGEAQIKSNATKQAAAAPAYTALQDATSNLDRLAAQASALANHPGLDGITGLRGAIPDVPGSAAANARAELDTLRSQVGFGVLQAMRDASKTGGALGSVSEQENTLLQSNLAALAGSQSAESFRANLKKVIDYANAAKGRMQAAYQRQYGGAPPTAGAPSAQPQLQQGTAGGRTIVRTGTLPDGRKVVQFSDGTTSYGN